MYASCFSQTGRKVPVILPTEVAEGLAFLADSDVRKKCGIAGNNIYLFANRGELVNTFYDNINAISALCCQCVGKMIFYPFI